MDEYRRRRIHIPEFGRWGDYAHDLPITHYFESATQAGFISYSSRVGDRDLSVVHDHDYFYQDHLKKPPNTTLVSHPKVAKGVERRYPMNVKEQRKHGRVCDVTEPPTPPHQQPPTRPPKAVDEDLYKVSPHLLFHNCPKRRKMLGFFSCLVPTCVT